MLLYPAGQFVTQPQIIALNRDGEGSVTITHVAEPISVIGIGRNAALSNGQAAPDPADPAEGPRVRVTCATEGLRNEVPQGTFSARCLGKVQDWNAEDAVLEVQAMAIFR